MTPRLFWLILGSIGVIVAAFELGPVAVGCGIKGNISANGRIYHMQGQKHYWATRINPLRGERWFCSESAARAAGWRKSRV